MSTNLSANRKNSIYALSRAAVFTAVTCILAPLSIPIGPVPISLTNLVLYLSLYLLGWKLATASLITYLAIGLVGVPVFSGFTGGAGKLLGPTGGYLVGFLPMVLLAGWLIDHTPKRWMQLLALILGTAVCYAFGTAWFCYETKSALSIALGACVFPFIPLDLLKIGIAMLLGPMLHKRLVQAGLLQ